MDFNVNEDKIRFAAEHFARYLFSICGYRISYPEFNDTESYDLLIEINGQFKKIQIKSTSQKTSSGKILFTLTKGRYNRSIVERILYTSKEVDYFYLYASNGDSWLIPFEAIKDKKNIAPEYSFPNFQITKKNNIIKELE